jgi:hypothetical protein
LKSIFNKISFSLICFLSICNALAQNDTTKFIIAQDTFLPNISANLSLDSSILNKAKPIKISKDAITNVINYGAVDSNFTDISNKEIHLYGKAYINYEKVKIKADYIIVNFGNNTIKAFDKRDSTYISKERPSFEDGDTKAGFQEIAYNFKTKKAFVRQLNTQESEFFIIGEKSKFLGKTDSTNTEDKFFQQGAIITTCNHIPPHFGIRTRKMKMIPNKIAVLGPAQIEIAGVPTPLILPFGFFPLIKGRSSGLIFPSDYQTDPNLGFGLRGIGYYFPVSDYMDVTLQGDIWTRGSFRVQAITNYKKLYKYSGSVDINIAKNVIEDNTGKPNSQKSFGLTLTHTQDSKAHPYRTIGGSINIQSNKNSQRTNFDYASRLNNKLFSNFNYTYRWPESPFSFRAALSHNQDNVTRVVNITLPDASLNMNTIQPFKLKNSTGDPLWYENISLNYRAGFRSYVKATDTTLFSNAILSKIETGFNHSTSLSTNARALKYFSISPSLNYEETYFLKTLNKELQTLVKTDSVQEFNNEGQPVTVARFTKYGVVKDSLLRDFNVLRKLNVGININTAIFGTKRFNKGFIRGIRHTMKPSVSFNYSPQTELKFRKYVNTDINDPGKIQYYNPFQTGAFPQSLNEEQLTMSYNISNIFELKYRTKKDTADRKINLFNNIYVGGNYNFAADSFNWSDVSVSGNADIIKGISSMQFSASFTPYQIDYTRNRKLKTFLKDRAKDKQLLELVSFNAGLNTNISLRLIKELLSKKDKDGKSSSNKDVKKESGGSLSFESLFERLNLNHNFTLSTYKTKSGHDSLAVGAHGIYINGSIPLSKMWDLNIGSISYDLKAKQLVYPSFGISRDLHCWTMRFSWYPSSGVYSFFIGVKSGALNFLKYDYNQPYVPRL